MARGRKPNLIPSTQWWIQVPIDLAYQVEARLIDPVTKRVTYAARSKLIQSLLHEWIRNQVGGTPPPAQEISPTPAPVPLDK